MNEKTDDMTTELEKARKILDDFREKIASMEGVIDAESLYLETRSKLQELLRDREYYPGNSGLSTEGYQLIGSLHDFLLYGIDVIYSENFKKFKRPLGQFGFSDDFKIGIEEVKHRGVIKIYPTGKRIDIRSAKRIRIILHYSTGEKEVLDKNNLVPGRAFWEIPHQKAECISSIEVDFNFSE